MKKFIWSILFAPFFLVSQTINDHNQVINQQNCTKETKSRFAIEFKNEEPKKVSENSLGCLERVGRIMCYCFEKTDFFSVDHKQLEIFNKEKID